jgi:hypothetical protein
VVDFLPKKHQKITKICLADPSCGSYLIGKAAHPIPFLLGADRLKNGPLRCGMKSGRQGVAVPAEASWPPGGMASQLVAGKFPRGSGPDRMAMISRRKQIETDEAGTPLGRSAQSPFSAHGPRRRITLLSASGRNIGHERT